MRKFVDKYPNFQILPYFNSSEPLHMQIFRFITPAQYLKQLGRTITHAIRSVTHETLHSGWKNLECLFSEIFVKVEGTINNLGPHLIL